MEKPVVKIIPDHDILSIIPLLGKLNAKTPESLLRKRLLEMIQQNYECAGLYINGELSGICGLWYSTRHYIGKSAEIDHVIIDEKHRDKGLGKLFLNWIYEYLKTKGCEGTELNTFVENRRSHHFYYNEGYQIYGFHMVKILRENGEFY